MLYPGDSFKAEVTTHKVSGVRSDAQSISAVLVHNGIDTAETVTITHKSEGVYTLSATVPLAWSRGDSVWFRATASVEGITGQTVVSPNTLGTSAEGQGLHLVTITVTDGSDPIEGAIVRMFHASEDYLAWTDALGQVVVGRNAATWNVAITKPMYTFTPTTLVVNDDLSVSYEMEALSITPSDPGFITGYLTCYDLDGQPKSGVRIEVQIDKAPTTVGLSFDTNIKIVTSNASGIASFPNLVPTATYNLRGGITKDWVKFTVPSTAGPIALNSLLRRDE